MERRPIDWVGVGSRLRAIRKEKRLSQRELGRLLGVSQNTISLYEKGKSRATVDFYVQAAGLGGKTIDWLLTGSGERVTETLREMRDLHEEMKSHLAVVRQLLDQEADSASEQAILAATGPERLREVLLEEEDLPVCLREAIANAAQWRELAMTGREIYALRILVRSFGEMSTGGLRIFLQLVRHEMGQAVASP